MSRAAIVALGLWAVCASLVFSVVCDVLTRAAAADFMAAQYHRRVQGAPLETIAGGFRPLMHAAAWQAAPWPIALLVVAAGATLAAERHSR
jgi:hypothetical protein